MTYPRGLVKGQEPFDPIEVAKETERIVIDGNKGKYVKFRVENFYGQIATARGVGCYLRCGFCWINQSKDFPEDYGKFYSPEEVYEKLIEISSQGYRGCMLSEGVRKSGCEPTIGKDHLLQVIEACRRGRKFKWFLLETNGILLGNDEAYVRDLSEFGDYVKVRLSLKAGTPEAFQRKTGAKAEFFELPFKAIEHLKKYKVPYWVAAMSGDPAIMPSEERHCLFERLVRHGEENIINFDEETADPFGITKRRLQESGIADPNEIKKMVYMPINIGLMRKIAAESGFGGLSITELLNTTLFETAESSCASCRLENPWHGHGVEDDLDEKLS